MVYACFSFFMQLLLQRNFSVVFWRFPLTYYFSTGGLSWSRIVMPMSLEEVNQENVFKSLIIYKMCLNKGYSKVPGYGTRYDQNFYFFKCLILAFYTYLWRNDED